MELRHCARCVYPETKPDLFFNAEGICSACEADLEKRRTIDWAERERAFASLMDQYRKPAGEPGWDCIVPVSGGKDSTYQVLKALEYGMNPLAVCFETTMVTEIGQRNLDNISRLGVDVVHFKKNSEAYKKMVIEGFERLGDEMWPNHIGIFTIPVKVAVNFGIPLIIWGENPQQEYGGPMDSTRQEQLDRRWLEEFGGLLGNRITDMVGVRGLTAKELTPYFYPKAEELEAAGIRGIFLGHYFFWNAKAQMEVVLANGFAVKEDGPVEGTYTNYENLDEKLVSLHDYLKYVKYGFGRATDHACLDIRHGRISRAEGIELVKQYDGKYPHWGIGNFIEYSGLSKEHIDQVIDSFTNPILFETDADGNFLRDADFNLIPTFEIR